MQDILELYRDRLTDLTKRNTSLRLLKLANKNHADVFSLATEESKDKPIRVAEEVMMQKSQIVLISAVGQSNDDLVVNRKLTTLKREIELIEQETGLTHSMSPMVF